MIEVKSKISIPIIQSLYKEFDSYKKAETSIDIILPKKFSNSDFGVLFSFLQFFATWARHPNSGVLVLPINNDEINDYLKVDFVYPVIALAWEKKIVNIKGENIRSDLKLPSKAIFQAMEYFELSDNNAVPIYCFDHDKNKRGHSRIFYNQSLELYPEGVVGINLTPAFQKIGAFNKQVFRETVSSNLDDFFAIIHELFGNTDEHAKTSAKGFNLYPNIRALYLRFHKKRIENLQEIYRDFSGLLYYFQSGFSLNSQSELYLIEISILDSGPGLVKRYKKTEILPESINDEVDIIKQCLSRHNTSAEGLRGTLKGIGLDRVLQTIDGKGFVRIKSGRADVFRDMKNNRYSEHNNPSEISLHDWNTNSDCKFTEHPQTEGTLISIFYPLDYKS